MDAVHLARGATGRDVILKIEGSYHGHHDAVMVSVRPPLDQLGARDEPSSIPFGAGHPDAIRQLTKAVPFNDADALERALQRFDVAAVIVEPAMMNITIVAPREGYLERVRELCDAHGAKLIFDEATRAIALNPGHDGAHHVLGAWHAEVKRLSAIQRFFAKALFGGGFMSVATWADAVQHLQRAVALNPQHIYHRLELAEVYEDLGQYSKAREQLTVIPTLPVADVLDPQYKRDAAEFLDDIKNEKDRT